MTLDVPREALSFGTFNWIFFIIGGVIIVGMQLMDMEKEAAVTESA